MTPSQTPGGSSYYARSYAASSPQSLSRSRLLEGRSVRRSSTRGGVTSSIGETPHDEDTPGYDVTGTEGDALADADGTQGPAGLIIEEALVYGTTVNVRDTLEKFRAFIKEFKKHDEVIAERKKERARVEAEHARAYAGVENAPPFVLPPALTEEADDDFLHHEDEPYYLELLRNALEAAPTSLSAHVHYPLNIAINAEHLRAYKSTNETFLNTLCTYPAEVVPIMDAVLKEFMDDEYARLRLARQRDVALGERPADDDNAGPNLFVRARVWNLPATHRYQMRELDPSHIDRLVSLRGMITRMTAIKPDMRSAFYRCGSCGASAEVPVERGRVDEPTTCDGCQIRGTMELVHNRSKFIDTQVVTLQEAPDNVPEGETPAQIQLNVYEEMVDAVVPGDRVVVTGMFKAKDLRPNPRMSTLRSIFSTIVDVIHFCKDDKEKLSVQGAESNAEYAPKATVLSTTETEDEIKERVEAMRAAYAGDGDSAAIYTALSASLAPSIWELDDVKKGVLLMLFGGLNKDLESNGKIRGEINVLLCGDPGTAKSQLLSYVHRISPRGMYTSGTGSSAVGLTAYVTKDQENRNEYVLESGALVLSDRGVCW